MLDAVVHGCIPVIVQDESYMFFEGSFESAGLGLDYKNFSVRIDEKDLPDLVTKLRAIPPSAVARMRRNVLLLRDYFVYKDMFNPDREHRKALLSLGRPAQDAFLLLTLALESRARALGRIADGAETAAMRSHRIHEMLGWLEPGPPGVELQ